MSRKDELVGLVDAFRELVDSRPEILEFPMGNDASIPTEEESSVLLALEAAQPLTHDEIDLLRRTLDLDRHAAYQIAIWGARTAVLAVRLNDPKLLSCAMLAVAIVDTAIDWQNVAVLLTVFEHCSDCLSVQFEELVQNTKAVATDYMRETVIDGYCAQDRSCRYLGGMGLKALGSGTNFSIIRVGIT